MVQARLPGISTTLPTRNLIDGVIQSAPAVDRPQLKALLTRSARSDGNNFLSDGEARLITSAYANANNNLAATIAAIEGVVTERAQASKPNHLRALFTSTTQNVNLQIVEEMRDTVARANGRPVDFNIMIFSFVDPTVGDEILRLARAHANVTFRLITDFGQLATTGNRQPPRLAAEALPNVLVKFKKDSPYTWSASAGRPVYNHGATKGLNHHKGFVALIDGRPDKLVTGTYNWSATADDKNYESVFAFDGREVINRPLLNAYQAEFTAFFNSTSTLSYSEATRWKGEVFNALYVDHGQNARPLPPAGVAVAAYAPRLPAASIDINHLSDDNYAALRGVIANSTTLRSVVTAFKNHGRFSSYADLLERVPSVARLSQSKRTALEAQLEFGAGQVPLNLATVAELERSLGITHNLALEIIAARTAVGDFESVEDLRALPSMTAATFDRIAPRLTDDVARMYFSSRAFEATEGGFGFAAENATRKIPLMGMDGVIAERDADLAAGVVDLLARAKVGDLVRLAMYGVSVTGVEYNAILDTARRGVNVKVVLENNGNAAAIAALKAAAAGGLPIDLRVQKARTLHQKIGCVNDDVFAGTANMTVSSRTKHSEDRIVVKNNAELAASIAAEVDRVYDRSKIA